MDSLQPSSVQPLTADPFFGEEPAVKKNTFDFALWFYRILKYWYLFILSMVICVSYAYIESRSWTPIYTTSATMVLEQRGNIGVANVNLGNLVQNQINQRMIITSYDLIRRTVDRLPQMSVAYYKDTKFHSENIYGATPISIECQFIAPKAYAYPFTVEPIDETKCRIFVDKEKLRKNQEPIDFSIEAPYNQYIQETLFYIKVNKTDRFAPNFANFNIRFVTKQELVQRYFGSVITNNQEGSTTLTISKNGANPTEDREFLEALLDEYQEYNLMLKNEAADRSIRFLTKQLSMIKDSLIRSESQFNNFQNETGIYHVEATGASGEERKNLMAEADRLQTRESALLQISEMVNSKIMTTEELPDASEFGITSDAISQQVNEYNNMLTDFGKMSERHPMYRTQKAKLDAARKQILQTLLAEQNNLMQAEAENQTRLSETESRMVNLPENERAYLRYERAYQTMEKYDAYLTQRIREAELQKASNVPDNYILEEPRQTTGVINRNEKDNTYMLWFIIGLAIPLAFVVCKEEIFNHSIATKEECERIAGFSVIGTVENVTRKLSSGRAIVKNFPKSSFAESFRNMRLRIEYLAKREANISCLVTSAEPADGKTFVAANIASVYQLTGKRVVLVDFDLRRPSVSKLLDVNSKRGVSNFLIGQATLNEILITHPEYGFDILPAGTLPPNPSELIKTKKTQDLIEYLRTKYDYIIIDCSPVGLVSDAYILAKLVDATIFVVRRGKTNKSFFKSVIQQVKNDGIYNVGLVFNDVKGREGYYGTSRYYGNKSYYLKRNSYYHDDYFEK